MTIKSVARTSACLIALSIADVAHADNAPNAETKDTIVVTAARGTQLKNLDVSATVLTPAEVQAAPETTTDQIINKIPGVFMSQQPVAQLHPTGGTFSIRGFGTTTNVNTLVMLDGIPMNDPYFRTVDWSQIPKGLIDRIEVIRGGGATSLWGNMAMGGIVNIVSKTPQADHIDSDFSYGSYNTLSGAVSAGLALSPKVTLGVNLGDTKTDGYNQTPVQYRNPYMVPTSSTNQNIQTSLNFSPTEKTKFYISYLWHQIQEEGLIWNITQNKWQTFRFSAGGSTEFGSAGSLNLNSWYGGGTMNTTNASTTPSFSIFNPTVGVPYVSQTENATYHNYGGSLVYQGNWGILKDVRIGADGRSISSNDPLNLFSTTAQTGNILSQAEHHFEGLFAQGTLHTPTIPLEVTLGLREDFWQTADGSINGVYKGASFNNTLANQSYSRFDPRLGAKLRLGHGFDLRAAAYSNFAAPGMNQMYRAFISGANFTTSNPALLPQTNIGEEVGFDFSRGAFSLEVTAYANKLKNFIDYATVQSGCALANNYCGTNISTISGGSLRQYVNAGDATFRGFEVLGGLKISRSFELHGGFTYTDAHLTRSLYNTASAGVVPDPVGVQIGQVPEWIATAGATWKPAQRLTLDVQLKSFPSYWNNTSHTQLNDAATIIDLGAQWQISRNLELYGAIQNVGDYRYNDQGLGYTTTNGSTVSGSTTPALGIPFMATFGIRAHI